MEISFFINFIERILLYQILIYFSISKIDNIIISQKEFLNKLNILLSDLGIQNITKINIPEDDDSIYRIILISILTISLLSIFNFNLMKFISGLISISIGFIYYNPFRKVNEDISKNIIIDIFIMHEFIPSSEFLLLISSGIAMIYQAIKNINIFYYIFCCCFADDFEYNKKRKKKRKFKINCQFEYDSKSNNSNDSN